MRFKSVLAQVMAEKEMSINKLSIITGVSRQSLNEYHKDRIQRYDSQIIAKVCQALKCEIGDLLKFEE
ncbi:MAG: transcriptional regulator [Sulfurimonas sp.]|nr:MAG: transcriptional regulator [Sulfurimonas sp.]